MSFRFLLTMEFKSYEVLRVSRRTVNLYQRYIYKYDVTLFYPCRLVPALDKEKLHQAMFNT